jgi:hypothetical protein
VGGKGGWRGSEAAEKVAQKWLCQLEGSDCGGRDRRPSWHWRALSILNRMSSFQLGRRLGANPILNDTHYTLPHKRVNEIL